MKNEVLVLVFLSSVLGALSTHGGNGLNAVEVPAGNEGTETIDEHIDSYLEVDRKKGSKKSKKPKLNKTKPSKKLIKPKPTPKPTKPSTGTNGILEERVNLLEAKVSQLEASKCDATTCSSIHATTTDIEVSSVGQGSDLPIDWKDENGDNINDGFDNLVAISDCQENNILDQIADLNFRIDFPAHDGEIAYDHIFCNGGRSMKLVLHDPSHGGDFDAHNGLDDIDTDRQRLELKPDSEWRSEKGTTYIYAHWFKLDKDIDAGSRFFHIFQIKTSNAKDSHPILTISMKKSDGLYFDYHEENGDDHKYRTQLLPLSEVGDRWFQVILVADYDFRGDAKLWFKDEYGNIVKYVHYDHIQMWYHDHNGGSHSGPAYSKYGLYRGMTEDLKDAAIELQNVQIWKK